MYLFHIFCFNFILCVIKISFSNVVFNGTPLDFTIYHSVYIVDFSKT